MASSASTSPVEQAGVRWTLPARIAFRFFFAYLPLNALCTCAFPNPDPYHLIIPDPATHWPTRDIVSWVGARVFHFRLPLAYTPVESGGGGDRPFDWALLFCLGATALLATAVWSFLDRKRTQYTTLNQWFRLFLRFALAESLLWYGMEKLIPVQMPFPRLGALLQRLGNFDPQGVLWCSMGAAPVYERFAGAAEVLGALLLFSPRTTMLGALVCLVDIIQVFVLNVGYDVGVKLGSLHMIVMALLLLAPDWRRLANLFFLNLPAPSSTQAPLFRATRSNRIALAAQVLFGLWLLGLSVYADWHRWRTEGGGRPEPALYGIWEVEQLTVDGQVHPPLLTDKQCWRRVLFESRVMAFERMDDSLAVYQSSIDLNHNTLVLRKASDRSSNSSFAFQRAADRLTLDGDLDGHRIHVQSRLFDRQQFPLVNHRFRWVRE